MARIVGVYGASGIGRELMPLLRTELANTETRLVFVDDGKSNEEINGQQVFDFEGFLALPGTDKEICIAVAAPFIRQRLAEKCESAGLKLKTARAANAMVMDDVQIGPGACISPFTIVTSNARIGKCFHMNIYSYVAHDCLIGDFVTFAPGAKCNGNVIVEDYAYIGTGAVIRQGRPDAPMIIGRGATVGMGAVVTKNVAAGTTVVGNPARVLNKE